MTNQPHPLDVIFGHLSPAEQQEAVDLIDYLSGTPNPAEGSLTSVLANASPRVQKAFALLNEALDTPRMAPFVRKMTVEDKARALDFDPALLGATKDKLDGEYVTAALQKRMGTDASLPNPPPSLRELIAAATEAHNG